MPQNTSWSTATDRPSVRRTLIAGKFCEHDEITFWIWSAINTIANGYSENFDRSGVWDTRNWGWECDITFAPFVCKNNFNSLSVLLQLRGIRGRVIGFCPGLNVINYCFLVWELLAGIVPFSRLIRIVDPEEIGEKLKLVPWELSLSAIQFRAIV